MCGCFGNMYTVLLTEIFLTFSVLFPQLYGRCQGKTRNKTRERRALFHISCYLCCSVVICVVRLLFVLSYVLFVCKCVLPSDDNPIAFNKYIISLFPSELTQPKLTTVSNTIVNNVWSHTSIPSCTFVALCLIKHSNNVTFTFLFYSSHDPRLAPEPSHGTTSAPAKQQALKTKMDI
jgi:hypothetical protein